MNYSFLKYLSGNVPGGIWLLFLLILITWFIAWYVYHFATILSRRRFVGFALAFTLLWAILYGTFWFLYPPPKERARLLLTFQETPEISDSFADLYQTQLHVYDCLISNLPSNKFIVYHPDWILQIGNWPAFSQNECRQKLLVFLRPDYIFTLSGKNLPSIYGTLVKGFPEKDTLLQASFAYSDKAILNAAEKIAIELTNTSLENELHKPVTLNASGSIKEWQLAAKARLSYLKNDLQQARWFAAKCREINPQFAPCLLELAKIELDSARIKKANGGFFQENLAQANNLLQKLKKIGYLTPEAYRIWGEYGILVENFVLAEEQLKKSYFSNPNQDQLYTDLARLHPSRYSDLRFLNEEDLYKYALFINPASIPARIWYGDYLFRRNEIQRALALYQKFLTVFPKQFDLQIALGKTYISAQQYKEAKDLFKQLLHYFQEDSSVILFNLGVATFHSGDTTAAQHVFEKIARTRSNPDVYLYLAEIAEKNGDIDTAITYLRRRIRENRGTNDPYKEEARRHLVQLLNKRENSAK